MKIEEVVNDFRKSILKLYDSLQEYQQDETLNPEVAGEILLQINLAKRDISTVYESFSKFFSDLMEKEQSILLNLSGGAIIEKKSSYDRKGWQHKELANVVVDRIIQSSVDMDTGEVLKSPKEIALDLLNYCAPSYWRIKELSAIGINADNYCESGELKTSIVVRKGDNQ